MDKVLTSNAIDHAFYAHVAKRFESLCAGGDGAHYEKARVVFEADLRFAQRAHDDVMAKFAAEDAAANAPVKDDAARAQYEAAAALDTGEPRSAADAKADAKAAKQAARDAKADS
jgi:hypothetical protein